ncbi:MAG: hypothetical protein K1X63_15710 [Chitinophagales bacterium]|nr:hypothetical protein [Chitinophagales bacterium]
MNDEDLFILLDFLNAPISERSIDEIKSKVGASLTMNPNMIEHSFINEMKVWVEKIKDNPSAFIITPQGKNKLTQLYNKKFEKNLADDFNRLNAEAVRQNLETLKAAKAAHDEAVVHNPRVRKLMGWNIATSASAVIVSLVSLITTIINATRSEQAQKQGQETQKMLQEQVQILDSLTQKIQNLDTLHVRLIEKESLKKPSK